MVQRALGRTALGQVCEAAELQPALEAELQRLKSLDWKSYETTKPRLNDAVSDQIAAAMVDYSLGMAAA